MQAATSRAMVSSDQPGKDYRTRRGELSAYGRAANSAKTLQGLVLLLTVLVIALLTIALAISLQGKGASLAITLLLGLCSIAGMIAIWFYARRNFIEPDLAFRKWLQQVCDGDLDAKIDLEESHAHYKELHFHTRNLATSLNRLSTDMETLVDNQTKRLESQNRDLDLLYNLTADVSRETARPEVLATVCRYLQNWFDSSVVTGYLRDNPGDNLLAVRCNAEQELTTVKGEPPPALVAQIEYHIFESSTRSGSESYIIRIPVRDGDTPCGMLVVETQNYQPAEQVRVERVLTTVAEQLSLFLSKQSALEQSRTAQMVRDRNALAADIHDSLAQTLAALRYQVTLLQDEISRKSCDEVSAGLQRIKSTVSEANQEVRGLIQEFRHPLSRRRSAEAIRSKVESFRESSGMQVFFQIDDPQLSFTPREESQLQRIIGEALNNAQKYSQASMVRVYLRSDDSGIRRILVEDDGIGFSHQDKTVDRVMPGENGGSQIGLTIMQERASSVGATLKIETEPGEGTRISIELPPQDKFAGD